MGYLWLKWVGRLRLNGWGSNFGGGGGDMLKKSTGLQESTPSGHRMTMGFGPFELLTRGLIQKGRTYYRKGGTTPCLRLALSEEPSIWLAFTQTYEYSNY